jgi:hypothetical protein
MPSILMIIALALQQLLRPCYIDLCSSKVFQISDIPTNFSIAGFTLNFYLQFGIFPQTPTYARSLDDFRYAHFRVYVIPPAPEVSIITLLTSNHWLSTTSKAFYTTGQKFNSRNNAA